MTNYRTRKYLFSVPQLKKATDKVGRKRSNRTRAKNDKKKLKGVYLVVEYQQQTPQPPLIAPAALIRAPTDLGSCFEAESVLNTTKIR
jgi:hypothetical protein